MKKGLFLVVALLALSTIMAAMAYSNANVTNPGELKIVSSDEALLSLTPFDGVGNKDGAASIEDGVLKIRPGYSDGNMVGLQKRSSYDWNRLFKVTNNSQETIEFNAEFQNGSSHKPKSNWTLVAGNVNQDGKVGNQAHNRTVILDWQNGNMVSNNKVTLEPGDFVWVRLQVGVGTEAEHFTSPVIIRANSK